jgi:hypothetical protein
VYTCLWSAGSALQSRPPTSQDRSHLSPSLSVCATLGSVCTCGELWCTLVTVPSVQTSKAHTKRRRRVSHLKWRQGGGRFQQGPHRHAKDMLGKRMGWQGSCGVGGVHCKAVPADESTSMTSTQTALGSREGPSWGLSRSTRSRPLARPGPQTHVNTNTHKHTLRPTSKHVHTLPIRRH